MARSIMRNLRDRTKFYTRRSRWNKVVTAMAAVVVFCTTYALILPAITLETEPLCGLEEHQHTDECWQIPEEFSCQPGGEGIIVLHSHNEFCYDANGDLICPLDQLEGHRHTDSCYAPAGDGQETTAPVHEHTDECYEEVTSYICGLEETEGHTHTEECEGETQELTCTREENHTHTDNCYEKVCTCEVPEGHTHGDSCWQQNLECTEDHEHTDECYGEPVLICDIEENHTHDPEACFTSNCICGEEEGHVHDDSCYTVTACYTCGLEESEGHAHSEECEQTEMVKKCGFDDADPAQENEAPAAEGERVLICEEEELYPHTHADECYDEAGNLICQLPVVIVHNHNEECLAPVPDAEPVAICGMEQHEHTDECRIDLEADLETEDDWKATLPNISGDDWKDNLLSVARSQMNYHESTYNYIVDEDTGEKNGITRYGQWYGDPYGDWCAYFIAFCRYYAGIPAEAFPQHPGQPQWCEALKEENWGIYLTPGEYTPAPGDTVYLDLDGRGGLDHVGIVEELIPATEEEGPKIQVIEGNSSNCVQRVKYLMDAEEILGYASLANARERWDLLHEAPKTYYCGLEVHEHTDECLDPETEEIICGTEAHVHDESCEVEPKTYYCGLEVHEHTDECIDPETEEIICGIEAHVHDESCEIEPKTYYCGLEVHEHTDECIDPETEEIICGMEAHVHDESCEIEPKTYYCGLEVHEHTDECMDPETEEIICGIEAHVHDESCEIEPKTYYCGLEVHEHTDECIDPETEEIICGIEAHVHDESCEIRPTYCGLTEHEHTDECLDPETGEYICGLEAHTHTEECYVETVYYCGKDEHTHGPECYDEEENLICTLEAHTHDESCSVRPTYCGLTEHEHTDECLDPETGEYICGLEAHTHTEECYVETVYYCGKDEHTHGPECYDEEENLICTLEVHTHTDACLIETLYYCGLEAHLHGETCYGEDGSLICTLIEHVHDEDCPKEFLCGFEAHTHGPDCVDENGNTLCTLVPHTHDETCKLKKQSVVADMGSGAMTLAEDQPSVTVEGFLPRGATVTAAPVQVDGMLFAYEITIYDIMGNVWEPLPTAPVSVSFYVPGVTDNPDLDLNLYSIPRLAEAPAQETEPDPASDAETDAALEETAQTQSDMAMSAAPTVMNLSAPMDSIGDTSGSDTEPSGTDGDTQSNPTPQPGPVFGEPILQNATSGDGTLTTASDEGSEVYGATGSHSCDLDEVWGTWIPTTNDNPFGSAQHYNVFVLGDVVGFNAIHGNAAIGGNIYGNCNTTIGYPEGSNFNYQADATVQNQVCLLLRGDIYVSDNVPDGVTPLPGALQVANGTAIIKESVLTRDNYDNNVQTGVIQIELDRSKRPASHYHEVPEANYGKFDDFFRQAGMNVTGDPGAVGGGPGSLQEHNMHIYEYATGLAAAAQSDPTKRDPHLGYNYRIADVPEELLKEVLGDGMQGATDNDIFLRGQNPFYNVFNLQSYRVAPDANGERKVWLDIPVGSYVVINILGRDENHNEITVIPDFGMQFWYRTTEGKWTKQPAEIRSMHGEGFNQSQMLLVNMDPSVTDVTFCQNNYFQASILAPNANMHSKFVNLEGTIVFKSMDSTEKSNIVYSPFYTGTSMNLEKEMVCDTPDMDHSTIHVGQEKKPCQIHENGPNGQAGWPDYYADVKFSVSTSLGGAGSPAVLKNVPIDGNFHHFGGLHPGYYTVTDELVYIKARNNMSVESGQRKERRLTVDEDGYWMVGMYLKPGYDNPDVAFEEDPNTNEWTLVYCDDVYIENGEYVCSIPANVIDWRIYDPGITEDDKAAWAYPNVPKDGKHSIRRASEDEFNIFRHAWNGGLFRRGENGTERPTLTVQSNNPVGDVTLVNHYSIDPKKSVTVYKEWGEDRTYKVAVGENQYEDRVIYVPVTPPPGAKIQVTLYRRIEGGSDVMVPAVEASEGNPGLSNPVTLRGPDNWYYMWKDLPVDDVNGNPYIYTVRESSGWPGWDGTVIDNGNGSFTIENRQKTLTGLRVDKEWFDANGNKLTAAQIEEYNTKNPDKPLKAAVQLYQQEGQAPKAGSEFEKDRRVLDIFLNDTQPGSHLGSVYYYPGSDVNILLDLFVVGDQAVAGDGEWLKTGKVNEMTLVLDGVKQNTTVHATTKNYLENQDGVHYALKTFSNIQVSCNILNLENGSTLILKTSDAKEAYPVIKEADLANIVYQNGNVYKPEPGITHTRYNPQYIKWSDKIVPYGALVDLSSTPEKWTHTWNGLPLSKEGDPDTRYGYFVVEEYRTEGYNPTYIYSQTAVEHDGSFYDANPPDKDLNRLPIPNVPNVTAGFVAIRNKPVLGGPELPMTGSIGTTPYTLGGLLLAISAGVLMQYNQKKRRKEDPSP